MHQEHATTWSAGACSRFGLPGHAGKRRQATALHRCLPELLAAGLLCFALPGAAIAAGVVGTGTPESCTEAALDAALAGGGMVTFNCGPEPVMITLAHRKDVSADTTVDGGGTTTLSGGSAVGVLSLNAGATLNVRNLTIANGKDGAFGGAIRAIQDSFVTLNVSNCTFVGNRADGGGAIYVGRGALTVSNSTFSGNATCGGCGVGGDCPGGAILAVGRLAVTQSTFVDNSAGCDGGGISAWADGDGAVAVTVANSTFSRNQAGGIFIGASAGTLTIANSTFVGNESGAVEFADLEGFALTATLRNTIIANSIGRNCSGSITDGGHNLQWPGTDCGATIQSLDPKLDPAGLKDNGGPTQTIALLPGSPAINAGDPEVCANPPVNGVDQRGYVRPGTGSANCSIGAYEYNSPGPPPSCAGDCDEGGEVTIDELITMVNIALGTTAIAECTMGDGNVDGEITVEEIIIAVNRALSGCAIPDVSGSRRRDQAVIRSSTCAAAVTANVQNSIDAGNWNCTYEILQSGQDLTIIETCPDGTDTFFGTVDSAGHMTTVRTEQETQDSCTVTRSSRFEADASVSSSTGTGRLQFHFTGCAVSDCVMVVESRFSRP